ncbi:EAL domain-containing protein [uncultured Psychromonas sp.]|uniref:bifunctional diguanylate cyclase/phosphodiesterase n=1 Tax=uncultured Psychromonas sp. TaxID=173974 RepID=UPI00262E0470|nr:EAL domain-containing protein [uncultured Psychromonas sp.]
MTLFNQINSLLLGLFLLVVTSLAYFQFTETKGFMESQISSDLNNTTNALTLMLKPHLETGDVASAETVINVIFEGGFYKKVSLTWLDSDKTQVWDNPIKVEGVPQWFLNLELFGPQSTESTITNGWIQLATLKLEANPAIGYSQLWKVMRDTLITLTLLFILSLIILRFRLKKILAPLHRVAGQAKLIAKREFQPDLETPDTIELKEVVLAINSMSGQLQTMFSQLDTEVVSLKNEKLTDKVSQLPNRLYLNAQLGSWIKDPGYGGVLIARLDWLEQIDEQFGYQVRDNTIRILAKEMQQLLPTIAPCVIARISSREFVFLVTKASPSQLKVFVQNVIRLINQAMISANYKDQEQFSIGVAVRTQGMSASKLLGSADDALQSALNNNEVCHWFENNEEKDLELAQWRDLLQEAIVQRDFLLQWHPAMSFENDSVLQREIYSGLKVEENVIRAAQFMPYIEQLELGSEFDQSLLKNIAEHPTLLANKEKVAINITQDSVLDINFHNWLGIFISRQKNPERFHFEIQESTVLTYPKQSQLFTNIIKQNGGLVGIDHYGREMGSVAYLQTIKPDYVKLDQSLSCNSSNDMEVDEITERLALSRAVINTARGVGIEVIITAVEDTEQLDRLRGLHANGYQGFITPPSYIY